MEYLLEKFICLDFFDLWILSTSQGLFQQMFRHILQSIPCIFHIAPFQIKLCRLSRTALDLISVPPEGSKNIYDVVNFSKRIKCSIDNVDIVTVLTPHQIYTGEFVSYICRSCLAMIISVGSFLKAERMWMLVISAPGRGLPYRKFLTIKSALAAKCCNVWQTLKEFHAINAIFWQNFIKSWGGAKRAFRPSNSEWGQSSPATPFLTPMMIYKTKYY